MMKRIIIEIPTNLPDEELVIRLKPCVDKEPDPVDVYEKDDVYYDYDDPVC